MNRTDFYKMFAAENGANQAESKETCIAVFNLLARCIKENDRVYIKGLGTFRKPSRNVELAISKAVTLSSFPQVKRSFLSLTMARLRTSK